MPDSEVDVEIRGPPESPLQRALDWGRGGRWTMAPRGRTVGATLANEEILPLGLDSWCEPCEFPVWWALGGAATVTASPAACSGDTELPAAWLPVQARAHPCLCSFPVVTLSAWSIF